MAISCTDRQFVDIATLLTRPIIRTGLLPHTSGPGSSKPPSTRDIPPVTLSNIPHVDQGAFKSYLGQIGSLYDVFRQAKEAADGDSSRGSSKVEPPPLDRHARGLSSRQSSISSLSVPNSASQPSDSPSDARRGRRKTGSRKNAHTVTPLSTIPNVYFEDGFHLENPRTFDIVSERSEIVRPPPGANGSAASSGSGRKALATNAILQEKLSWYMDTVEIHLISSISSASTSFFAALGSLRELHNEAAESVVEIRSLRKGLQQLDQDMALGGLKVVALHRRRENVRRLGDAISQLREVVTSVVRCEVQIEKGELEEALAGLSCVEKLMRGEPSEGGPTSQGGRPHRLLNLQGMKALVGADSDIVFLRRKVGKAYESQFIGTLLKDLRGHVDGVSSSATLQRWDRASHRYRGSHARSPSAFPAYLQVEDDFRSSLRSQLRGMARSLSVMPATLTYREAVLKEVKTLIRRHLPSSNDDDNESTFSISTQEGRRMTQQEKSSILARNLRSLEAEDAFDMLKNIYSNVGEVLRRLGTQVKVLLDITSSIANPPLPSTAIKSPLKSPQPTYLDHQPNSITSPPTTPATPVPIQQDEIQQALDLSSLLGQAVDIAHSQIIKVLKVRSDQSTHLPLSHFLRYFTINRLFADECEAVSGRTGIDLKTVVNGHIKEFVARFGDIERQRLVQAMDSDRWDASDFTEVDSARLDRIVHASSKDVELWSQEYRVWESEQKDDVSMETNGSSTNGTAGSKDKIRSAVVEEQKYMLPASAMAVMGGIENFEHLITGIPSMSQEIGNSLLDYLKLFNSRSSQLILGAGATRSAGLKNITTKHLALSSQALSFVIALIPYIREFARRLSVPGTLMVEFDKVKRLYQEHQIGIHDKLVDIMSGRASSHVAAMKKIDWDAPADSPSVNTYMETLVKETATLHRVLSKHLPETTVQRIMEPVFQNYEEQWGTAFEVVNVKTAAGKERSVVIHSELCVNYANRPQGTP